jgi:hypothetical protein
MISGRTAATADETIRARGVETQRAGLLLGHHQHSGSAVVEQASVARGDAATGFEHWL